jgi:spore coat polysaccharide biosynthesis protein SpsF
VAIVQARMGSRRLPGKSLLPLAGKPVVLRVVERVAAATTVDEAVVATSTDPADDPIAHTVEQAGIRIVRGSETDVLDRFRQAAEMSRADAVVRITADCPLHDPRVIDRVVGAFQAAGPDYASNVHPPTYPDGLDTEVFTRSALDTAAREARLPSEREHVTPFLWKQPQRFRLLNVTHDADLNAHRWVLDDERDLRFLQAVYDALAPQGKLFGMEEVLRLLQERPELLEINRDAPRNEGYAKSLQADDAWRSAPR